MKYALVDSDNIVQNIIVYYEGANYTPAEGLTVQQVNDWVKILDHKDTPEPALSESALPE